MLKHSLEISNNAQNIQINSSRISDIKGIHEIMMIDECETISIRHDVSDRKIFAVNSLKIAHWIHKISRNGLYHMNDFLEFGAEV
jgi:dihydrodipicolinate reductase